MFESRMTLKVRFIAGTDITEAILEAKQKAIILDLAGVEFNFNGVEMYITQHTDIQEAIIKYLKG